MNKPKMRITFGNIKSQGVRWGYYGRGGAGKTTIAIKQALAKAGLVAIVDAEHSLSPLLATLTAQGMDMSRVKPVVTDNGEDIGSIEELREFLADPVALKDGGVSSIIIDSMTTLDGWYGTFICRHFKNDPKSGGLMYSEEGFDPPMRSRESFGYGKDNTAAYETNDLVLADLDRCIREGIDVYIIMHECDLTLTDARGDVKVTMPRLQHPLKNPKNSIANRMRDWLDNLGYIFRARETDEDNRVVAIGGRAVAFTEVGTGVPGMDGTFWAKGRSISGIRPISEMPTNNSNNSNKTKAQE